MLKSISVNDNLEFDTHHEILNECFLQYLGKEYKGFQKGFKHIVGKYYVWFPVWADEKNGEILKGSKNSSFYNIIKEGGRKICEYSEELEPLKEGADDTIRLVFGKNRRGKYKFWGVYKSAERNEEGYSYLYRLHKRISEKLDLTSLDLSASELELIKELDLIEKSTDITETEKETIGKARIGQSKYRQDLLKIHEGRCMLCGLGVKELLVASHVKSWSDSTNRERIDSNNGLLLCSQHDALFDKHFITFDDFGRICISSRLTKEDKSCCNISEELRIEFNESTREYMKCHRRKFIEKDIWVVKDKHFLSRAIELLREIENDYKKREWCLEYDVYTPVAKKYQKLKSGIDEFIDKAYNQGYVPSNYVEIFETIEKEDIYLRKATKEELNEMTDLQVVSCIASQFRHDHFSEGVLIREYIAKGILLSYFEEILRRMDI